MAVVIKAPHNARVFAEGHAKARQMLFYGAVEGCGFYGQMIPDQRSTGDNGAVRFILGIQNAQRVLFQPQAAVMAQSVTMGGKIGNQRRAIGITRGRITQRIDFQHRAFVDAEFLLDMPAAGDHLRIGQGFGSAQDFNADLVELPIAPLLRAFIAKHRPGIENLARQIGLREAVGNQGAANTGSHFRAQSQALPTAIGEAVHFLGNHIGSVTKAAGENARVFKNGGRPFFKAIKASDTPRGFGHRMVAAEFLTDQITGATGGLQLAGHAGSVSCLKLNGKLGRACATRRDQRRKAGGDLSRDRDGILWRRSGCRRALEDLRAARFCHRLGRR